MEDEMKTRLFASLLPLLAVCALCVAQNSKTGDQRYKLLATTKTSTMEKELNEAAAQGYRILVGSPTSGKEMAIFLERAASPGEPYKYKLLATTRTGTMQKELNEAAEGGYRLLPRTMIAKAQAIIGGVEIVVVLERPPAAQKRYEYKLLATNLTSTLQKEVTEAQAAGFVIVGMVSRGEHMVILERESGPK
jgi:hypothetical protein